MGYNLKKRYDDDNGRRKEVALHVSKAGGFKETTIGFKAMESLLHMGE